MTTGAPRRLLSGPRGGPASGTGFPRPFQEPELARALPEHVGFPSRYHLGRCVFFDLVVDPAAAVQQGGGGGGSRIPRVRKLANV